MTGCSSGSLELPATALAVTARRVAYFCPGGRWDLESPLTAVVAGISGTKGVLVGIGRPGVVDWTVFMVDTCSVIMTASGTWWLGPKVVDSATLNETGGTAAVDPGGTMFTGWLAGSPSAPRLPNSSETVLRHAVGSSLNPLKQGSNELRNVGTGRFAFEKDLCILH